MHPESTESLRSSESPDVRSTSIAHRSSANTRTRTESMLYSTTSKQSLTNERFSCYTHHQDLLPNIPGSVVTLFEDVSGNRSAAQYFLSSLSSVFHSVLCCWMWSHENIPRVFKKQANNSNMPKSWANFEWFRRCAQKEPGCRHCIQIGDQEVDDAVCCSLCSKGPLKAVRLVANKNITLKSALKRRKQLTGRFFSVGGFEKDSFLEAWKQDDFLSFCFCNNCWREVSSFANVSISRQKHEKNETILNSNPRSTIAQIAEKLSAAMLC